MLERYSIIVAVPLLISAHPFTSNTCAFTLIAVVAFGVKTKLWLLFKVTEFIKGAAFVRVNVLETVELAPAAKVDTTVRSENAHQKVSVPKSATSPIKTNPKSTEENFSRNI